MPKDLKLCIFCVVLLWVGIAGGRRLCSYIETRPSQEAHIHALGRIFLEEGHREGPQSDEQVSRYAAKNNLSQKELTALLARFIWQAEGAPEQSLLRQQASGAVYVLGALRIQSGLPVLEEVVATSNDDGDRCSAIRSIVRIGADRSFEFVRAVIQDQERFSEDERRTVYEQLSSYVGVSSVNPVRLQTSIPEEEVRRRRDMVLRLLRNALVTEPDLGDLMRLDAILSSADPGCRTQPARRLMLLRLAKSDVQRWKEYGAKELKALLSSPDEAGPKGADR